MNESQSVAFTSTDANHPDNGFWSRRNIKNMYLSISYRSIEVSTRLISITTFVYTQLMIWWGLTQRVTSNRTKRLHRYRNIILIFIVLWARPRERSIGAIMFWCRFEAFDHYQLAPQSCSFVANLPQSTRLSAHQKSRRCHSHCLALRQNLSICKHYLKALGDPYIHSKRSQVYVYSWSYCVTKTPIVANGLGYRFICNAVLFLRHFLDVPGRAIKYLPYFYNHQTLGNQAPRLICLAMVSWRRQYNGLCRLSFWQTRTPRSCQIILYIRVLHTQVHLQPFWTW